MPEYEEMFYEKCSYTAQNFKKYFYALLILCLF